MIGMSRSSGLALGDTDHLHQSLRDIATTRIGTRLCRRDYGSLVPDLIDQPVNNITRLRLMSALAAAYIRFEPRVRIQRVQLLPSPDAAQWDAQINLLRIDTPQPQPMTYGIALGAAT